MALIVLKLCLPCWQKRTNTAKPCKVTIGRECADCKQPGTGTLVPYEVDVPKPYEAAQAVEAL